MMDLSCQELSCPLAGNVVIAYHNTAVFDDFPWNSDTKVRLTTGSYDLYATFTKYDTEIHF